MSQNQTQDKNDSITAIPDGKLLDYITGKLFKDNGKEQVRQRIARALFHEYGISVEDMEPEFSISVGGRKKKVGIAIFRHGKEHELENVRRVVVCEKEPTGRGITKMRSHEQAKKDLQVLQDFMTEAGDTCEWGLWTNGLEFFFLQKEVTRFDVKFKPVGDWPMGDETLGTRDVASIARMRKADPELLRVTFRRCHNFIHGNEGMSKDVAFRQFLYLIFAKMHDERNRNGQEPRFWAGATEQFEDEGRVKIRERIEPLFKEVKEQYASIFQGNEQIELSDRALAFMVSELAKYDFNRTDIDAKGAAYQEIVGDNLRGDRGQYFTPRGAIKLLVDMLDPQPHERVLDPACGTGGFLISTVNHLLKQLQKERGIDPADESTAEFLSLKQEIKEYVETNLFGADFDPALVKTSKMNLMMSANAEGDVFHMDSLAFPKGHLDGNEPAKEAIPLGSIDVLMTNPPFGSDIPISEPEILRRYDLAHVWERNEESGFINTGRLQSSVAPEILFIERSIRWLKPGGRMGIVLPDGILGNPATEYIRWWVMKNCYVLASVDLPVEVFIVEANVNILTSLLFFKKKTDTEIRSEALGGPKEYKVFMAVAEKVGYDRRGVTIYKKNPDGKERVEDSVEKERIRLGGETVVRAFHRKKKIIDDDLIDIASAYKDFKQEYGAPDA